MTDRDYYNVLGLSRSATPEQVKRAYRRLAMRWHPDRNLGDPVAERRFKEVHAAYRVLSDPLERERYDRLGPLFQPDGGPPRPDVLRDAVRRAWNDLVGRKVDGEAIHYTLRLDLEDAARGIHREVVVPRRIHCPDCKGLGAPVADRHTCGACKGSGRANNLLRSRCFHCDGRGFVIDTPCGTCAGGGLVEREEAITVKVPAGVDTGTRLRVAERGHCPSGDGPPGDLLVLVDVADHALFRRDGGDLRVTLPLPLSEAILGADVPVPTLDGATWIRIPPGTPHGHVLRLGGRGMPDPRGDRRGDLLVEVELELPQDLSTDEQAMLARWAEQLDGARHPRRRAWNDAVEARR